MGRKNARQPERKIYLRTLGNLSNPSEVRGVLSSMSRLGTVPKETTLTASRIEFAQQMPRWRLHRDELNRAPLAHEDWRY